MSNFIKEKNILFCKNNIQEEFNMEKNKQSLQLARTSLTITLFIWFLALTIFFAYTYFLFPMFLIYLIPTILNIIISYEKRYEQNDFFGTIVITLLSYIIFGVIMISIAPHLCYILYSTNCLFNTFLFNI